MTKTAFPKGLLSVFQLSLNNSCIFSFTAVLYVALTMSSDPFSIMIFEDLY